MLEAVASQRIRRVKAHRHPLGALSHDQDPKLPSPLAIAPMTHSRSIVSVRMPAVRENSEAKDLLYEIRLDGDQFLYRVYFVIDEEHIRPVVFVGRSVRHSGT